MRRRRRTPDSVELNLAAMLDMAFQLLTFFILTFRPVPIEGQLALHLPPPKPATDVQLPQNVPASDEPGSTPVRSLILTIRATSEGEVKSATMQMRPLFKGPADASNLYTLSRALHDVLAIEGEFEQVLIRVGPNLKYEELMKVIDVCTRQRLPSGELLTKISFAELPEEADGAPQS